MPRRTLTLKEKIEIIEYHKLEKCSIRKLAEHWKIGKTQAAVIIKNSENLLNVWSGDGIDHRFRMSPLTSPGYQIDKSVFEWFSDLRNRKIPVSGPMLRTKALEIAGDLGRVGFKASNGWLERFRRRHMISFITEDGESGTLDSECSREAVAKAITSVETAQTVVQSYDSIKTSLYSYREKMKKKGGKNFSVASDQSNNESNPLPLGTEASTPDVEMQCSESKSMDTQDVASTSFVSNTDVIFKQEIIETELEPSTLDDSSFHSSIAGPSGMQCDGQKPSTSYQTFSESSNSNTDFILPDKPDNVAAIAPTLPHGLRIANIESVHSRDAIPETNTIFYYEPPILNVTKPSSSTRYKFIQPKVPPLALNITYPKNSLSNEKVQNVVNTESPALAQVSDTTGNGVSRSNNSIQTEVLTQSSSSLPARDEFDAFGEFIAFKLRNLDPKSRTLVQKAFAELLFKAELGMFLNGNEKSDIGDIQIHMPVSDSEIARGPRGKENIQPVVSSLKENTDFGILKSEDSSRNDIPQPGVPSEKGHSSLTPVRNTGSENTNEPIQSSVTSHIGNKHSPVLNLTDPGSVSSHSSNQTKSFPQAVSPAFLSDSNLARSTSNQSLPPRVQFRDQPRDEFDAYGEFAAAKLRKLDTRSSAFLQTAFADLIFEAELGRFLSDGEKSIFANKTNDIIRNMPSANSDTSSSTVQNSSKYDARPTKDFVTPAFCESDVPFEKIPSMQ